MTRSDITFLSAGTTCAAWRYRGESEAFASPAGRPCVVMAHGFSGTRDVGLEGYAEAFARAGLDVLLFDYRGFGGSEGAMPQHIDVWGQRADYHAAIAAARRLDGVDPDRIVLWGTSYSGGHVLSVAARDQRVAAVISMTPAVDGLPVLWMILKGQGLGKLLSLSAAGLRDRFGSAPEMLQAIGPAGSAAVIAEDGALETFEAAAGPLWKNEVRALRTGRRLQPAGHQDPQDLGPSARPGRHRGPDRLQPGGQASRGQGHRTGRTARVPGRAL